MLLNLEEKSFENKIQYVLKLPLTDIQDSRPDPVLLFVRIRMLFILSNYYLVVIFTRVQLSFS